jgi:hypothetical protein
LQQTTRELILYVVEEHEKNEMLENELPHDFTLVLSHNYNTSVTINARIMTRLARKYFIREMRNGEKLTILPSCIVGTKCLIEPLV